MQTQTQTEAAVEGCYAAAAQAQEAALCCPVDCDPRYLDAIPAEVLDRDYSPGEQGPRLRRHHRGGVLRHGVAVLLSVLLNVLLAEPA